MKKVLQDLAKAKDHGQKAKRNSNINLKTLRKSYKK